MTCQGSILRTTAVKSILRPKVNACAISSFWAGKPRPFQHRDFADTSVDRSSTAVAKQQQQCFCQPAMVPSQE